LTRGPVTKADSVAINILDKLANLRDNLFLYGESTSELSQLIVRRGPGRTEKRMPTKSIDVIISFLFLGEGRATELATAQSLPFLIGLGALCSIVPNEKMALKEVTFKVRTGGYRQIGEIKVNRGKFEGHISPARRITPLGTIEISLFLGTKTGLPQTSALQSVSPSIHHARTKYL